MLELINASFESEKLPDGWLDVEGAYTDFEDGALKGVEGGTLGFRLPGGGWKRLRVECEIEPLAGAFLTCGDGTFIMQVDLGRGRHRVTPGRGLATLASQVTKVASDGKRYSVVFDYEPRRISAAIDGAECLSMKDERWMPAAGWLELGFYENCLVHRVRVTGDEPVAESVHPDSSRTKKDFHLEVTVDFTGDVSYVPFDGQMFDRMFAEFKTWGVKRCHWIYYGSKEDGWWENGALGWGKNAYKTMENIGEIFPAAVKAAHAHGIEIYAVFKPFEMGFYFYECDEKTTPPKAQRIGGPIYSLANFVVRHPEWLMARKPHAWGDAENETFTRIDLVKEDAELAAFSIEDVQLFVSDDNKTYHAYEGPVVREEIVEDYPLWEHTASGGRRTDHARRARVMRLKDLCIRNKYVVLSVDGRDGSFANTLVNLIHVFGEKGEERRYTYGLVKRIKYENTQLATDPKRVVTDFRRDGIEFDVNLGSPSSVIPGYDVIRERHILDSGDGVLAIARGKDRTTESELSPSYPQVREWWLGWVRKCLDAGADGLELRVHHHSYHLTWGEFGFEDPVRDEFLKRYGVDIWKTDDFDKTAWRKLRGEAYTEFYREARKLAQSYGKPVEILLGQMENMEPENGAAMEIHWDWRRWIDESLADGVVMRGVSPGTRFSEDVLSHARRKGIPVTDGPPALSIWQKPGGEKVVADWINNAKHHGYDAYQYYESATVIKWTPQGKLLMTQPALKQLFQEEFSQSRAIAAHA